jgi:hypothetical protein
MFIFPVGDGGADAPTPQIPLDVAAAIGFITHHATRTVLGATLAAAFDRTARHERFKPNGFMPLTRCQYKRHQLFFACRAQMHFGAEAPLAVTQGFDSFGGTCRMLMSANDRAIDIVNRPVHLASGIRLLLNGLKQTLPEASSTPAIEAAGHGAPGTIAFWQLTPGDTGAQQPQEAVDNPLMV